MVMNIIYKKLQIIIMKQQIINKIQKYYNKSQSRNLDKFFSQNRDVENYCNDILKNIPWFQTLRNVFIAISHNIFNVVLCKQCNKPLNVQKAIFNNEEVRKN